MKTTLSFFCLPAYLTGLTAYVLMVRLLLSGILLLSFLCPRAQKTLPDPIDPARQKKMVEEITLRYNNDLSGITGQHKKYIADIYKERYELVKEKFESREILTDAQSYNYLNRLLQEVLRANQLPMNDIRIAFTREWWANASSMGEGTLLFNIGLFHRMDNEAQAIFVICHELAHYYLNHGNNSIHSYVNTVYSDEFQNKLKNIQKSEYRRNSQVEDLAKGLTFRNRRHSRMHEAAADSMALVLMKKTGYDLNQALTCLALLDSSDKRKFNRPVDLQQIFNFPAYPFKKHWLRSSTLAFTQATEVKEEPEADSLKTHPDCGTRIEKLKPWVEKEPSAGRKKFIVSEETFMNLRERFDYEVIRFSFESDHVSKSLYMTLSMLQFHPEDPWLHIMVGKCLLEIHKKQKSHELGKITDAPGPRYSEDYNQLLRMIQALRLQEIAALCYHYLDSRAPSMSGNREFDNIFNASKQIFQ